MPPMFWYQYFCNFKSRKYVGVHRELINLRENLRSWIKTTKICRRLGIIVFKSWKPASQYFTKIFKYELKSSLKKSKIPSGPPFQFLKGKYKTPCSLQKVIPLNPHLRLCNRSQYCNCDRSSYLFTRIVLNLTVFLGISTPYRIQNS